MATRYRNRCGWLRNQRAVTADEDGLRVERWLGRARHIPWGDVIGTRWMADGALVVDTLGGCVRVGRGAEGLAEAVERFVGAGDGANGRPFSKSDVKRWLGGFRTASSEPVGRRRDLWMIRERLYAVAVFVGLVFGIGAWEPLIGLPLPVNGDPMVWALIPFALCFAAPPLLLAAVLLGDLSLSARSLQVITATTRGVTVASAAGSRSNFRWDEVAQLDSSHGKHTVLLADGRTVALRDLPQFAPVINCLHAVLRRREGFHAAETKVPDAALSPARMTDSGEAERGLSKADAK